MSLDTLISTVDTGVDNLLPQGTTLTRYPPAHEVELSGGYWDISHLSGIDPDLLTGEDDGVDWKVRYVNDYRPEGIWGLQPVLLPETDKDELFDNGNLGVFKMHLLRAYDARDYYSPLSTLDESRYIEAAITRAPLFAKMDLYVFGQLDSGNTDSDWYNTNTLNFSSLETPNLKYARDAVENGGSTPLYLQIETRSFANRILDYEAVGVSNHMLSYFDSGHMHRYFEETGTPIGLGRYLDTDGSDIRAGAVYDKVIAYHPDEVNGYKLIEESSIPTGSGSPRPLATLHMANWPTAAERKQHGFIQLSYAEDEWGVRFPNWQISLDVEKTSIFTDVGEMRAGYGTDEYKGVDYNPYLPYIPSDDVTVVTGAAGSCAHDLELLQHRGFEFYQKIEGVNGFSGFAIGRVVFENNIQVLTTNLDAFGADVNAELDAQQGLANLVTKTSPNWNITKVLIPKTDG